MFCFNSKKVGYVKKTHGIKGEWVVALDFKIPDNFILKEWVFLKYEGMLIPFSIDYYQVLDNWTILIKCHQVTTIEEAKRFLFAEFHVDANLKWIINLPKTVIGYQVYDKQKEYLGTIIQLISIPNNPVVETVLEDKKILVPFNTAIIKKIDHHSQMVFLTILKNELLDD